MRGNDDTCRTDNREQPGILPSGRISWQLPPYDRCFAANTGSGLLALATSAWPTDSGREVYYLGTLAREALTRFAHSCQDNAQDDQYALGTILLPRQQLEKLVQSAPPMRGGEYLTPRLLAEWLESLRQHILGELDARKLPAREWLSGLGEPWNRIGRVFFHLAENRDDATGRLPFAFLATFAHKTTTGGELSHLPLGRAVQLYHDDHRSLLTVLEPLKVAARESNMLAGMIADNSVYAPQAWDPVKTRLFLNDIPAFEKAGILVRMVNLWKKTPARMQIEVVAQHQDETPGRDSRLTVHSILSFSVAACLGGRRLTPDEIEELLASGGGLIRFKGEWVDVDADKIKLLLEQWHKATGMMNRLGIPLIQGLKLLVNGPHSNLPSLPAPDSDCRYVIGEKLDAALRFITDPRQSTALKLTPLLDGLLRDYQREGVAFLQKTTQAGFGACLADDMGLGKTLQCLAWLSHLKQTGELSAGPAIIMMPASLLGNWQDEIAKFALHLRVAVLHPSSLGPARLRRIGHSPHRWLHRHDIVLTSYGMATRLDWLRTIDFPVLVLDEAQAVKNAQSLRTAAIRELSAARKVALSGTPIENSLTELWSLMDILNPGLLGNKKEFAYFTGKLANDFSSLRKLTHPFILRRMKTDPRLIPDLPDKIDMPAYCNLTPLQAALYQTQVETMHAILDEPDPSRRLMRILPLLAKFKQICNHPSQFLGRGDYAVAESGKFLRLQELAGQIAQRQEKLIIFTQFRAMTDPLHQLLSDTYQRPGLILHGGTPVNARQQLVNAFQREDGPPFFVLSLKAAGTGLTLTQASHVIHFDRWWNPAVENQATDRAYRIGQRRNVIVHRLICQGTIEDRIDHMLRQKQQLADTLFDAGFEKLLIDMTPDEIRKLLAG